jgi:23S rRNA (cytosine1962-C5)-methyltransferase
MTKVYLNKRITPRIAMGHPWIYNNEVDRIAGTVAPGILWKSITLMAN